MRIDYDENQVFWVNPPSDYQVMVKDGLPQRDTRSEASRIIFTMKMNGMEERASADFRKIRLVFVLINRPEEKARIKKWLDEKGYVSQFITTNIKRNMAKMGIFTNLLRQINAKLRLDLYRITLPQKITQEVTMFVGIDVCHKGRTSIVGLAASSNAHATQHYCYVRH